MRRFLVNIGSLFLITTLLYISLVFFLGYLQFQKLTPNFYSRVGSSRFTYTRVREVKNFKNIDILFLGSSAAMRGFDTRIFKKNGLITFNLGTNSQVPLVTKVFLNRYLDELNPKLIVLQVSTVNLSIDGLQSALDAINNDKSDMFSFKMALAFNNIKVYNSLLYGFLKRMLHINTGFRESPIKDIDTYISGGYVSRKIQVCKKTTARFRNTKINEIQFNAFNDIINTLKERNVNFILVNVPFNSEAYKTCLNNSEFDSIMNRKSKYYNFNKILTLNDSLDFFDHYHLNQNGVEVFNNKLIEVLNTEKLVKHN